MGNRRDAGQFPGCCPAWGRLSSAKSRLESAKRGVTQMEMTAEQREGADFATTQKPDVISLFGIFRRSSKEATHSEIAAGRLALYLLESQQNQRTRNGAVRDRLGIVQELFNRKGKVQTGLLSVRNQSVITIW